MWASAHIYLGMFGSRPQLSRPDLFSQVHQTHRLIPEIKCALTKLICGSSLPYTPSFLHHRPSGITTVPEVVTKGPKIILTATIFVGTGRS